MFTMDDYILVDKMIDRAIEEKDSKVLRALITIQTKIGDSWSEDQLMLTEQIGYLKCKNSKI